MHLENRVALHEQRYARAANRLKNPGTDSGMAKMKQSKETKDTIEKQNIRAPA
jgi:hypothetical protein